MIKADSLRAHIVAALPELGRDPERLRLWTDNGTIRSRQTPNFNFSYQYRLNLFVLDWGDHPSVLMILILDWLRINQPDLIASQASDGFTFEADILSSKLADILVTLNLTEDVIATRREDGGWDMHHLPEPDPMFPADVAMGDGALFTGAEGNFVPGGDPGL